MSLHAPLNKAEQKFQYCNYGFDPNKFRDFNDCMANYDKVVNTKTIPIENVELLKKNVQIPTKQLKTKEPIYYVLITAGVMIVGYFAYKKFKK